MKYCFSLVNKFVCWQWNCMASKCLNNDRMVHEENALLLRDVLHKRHFNLLTWMSTLRIGCSMNGFPMESLFLAKHTRMFETMADLCFTLGMKVDLKCLLLAVQTDKVEKLKWIYSHKKQLPLFFDARGCLLVKHCQVVLNTFTTFNKNNGNSLKYNYVALSRFISNIVAQRDTTDSF